VAFRYPEKQILVEPVFRLSCQYFRLGSFALQAWMSSCRMPTACLPRPGPNYGRCLAAWLMEAIHWEPTMCSCRSGPGDSLFTTPSPLGLHTTTLILGQGLPSDARGSKLMPDKKDFGYSFPCDGPGRWQACDISSLGRFYLSRFLGPQYVGWWAPSTWALEALAI